jgi:hypothetical protein
LKAERTPQSNRIHGLRAGVGLVVEVNQDFVQKRHEHDIFRRGTPLTGVQHQRRRVHVHQSAQLLRSHRYHDAGRTSLSHKFWRTAGSRCPQAQKIPKNIWHNLFDIKKLRYNPSQKNKFFLPVSLPFVIRILHKN